MEDCSQAPITEQEASRAIGQLVSIETKADLINALDMLAELGKKLNAQVDEMGNILQANAIAEAKANSEQLQAKAKEISDRYPFSWEVNKIDESRLKAVIGDFTPTQDYVDFMAALERGDHLDTIKLPLHK